MCEKLPTNIHRNVHKNIYKNFLKKFAKDIWISIRWKIYATLHKFQGKLKRKFSQHYLMWRFLVFVPVLWRIPSTITVMKGKHIGTRFFLMTHCFVLMLLSKQHRSATFSVPRRCVTHVQDSNLHSIMGLCREMDIFLKLHMKINYCFLYVHTNGFQNVWRANFMILNCGLFACFCIKLLGNNSKVLPVILS